MVERDTLLAKLATIDRCLNRIADARARRATLLPIDAEDIIVLNLQRAVQAAIDVAVHIIATEGWGLPDSVAGAFTTLERQGVVAATLAERLRKMTGFRNIAVHDYTALDPVIVERIVERHLDDLRDLASEVMRRYRL